MFMQRYAGVIALTVVFMLSGITTAQAQPDLVINDFTVSTNSVKLGVPFSATVTMANQGTSNVPIPATGGAVYYSVYLSLDNSYDAADICAGYGGIDYQTLTPGAIVTGTPMTLQVNPEDWPAGAYYVITRADALCESGDHVVEKSETNNDLTGDQITMLPSTAVVDLKISNLVGPTSVVQGAYLRLDTYLVNLGPDTAPGRTAASCGHIEAFYLSKDTTITTSDTLIGSVCLNNLAGNTTYRFWMDVRVPATLPTGRYYWGAIADHTKVLVETNETNNAFAVTRKSVTVTAPK